MDAVDSALKYKASQPASPARPAATRASQESTALLPQPSASHPHSLVLLSSSDDDNNNNGCLDYSPGLCRKPSGFGI